MQRLPEVDDTLLVRTDFSDEQAWQALWTAVETPNEDGFTAYVHLVEDPAYRDLTPGQLVALAPVPSLLIVADHVALTHPEHPLLVIDVTGQGSRDLRVIPDELWAIENNLSIANLDWEDFAGAVGADGIFRGH